MQLFGRTVRLDTPTAHRTIVGVLAFVFVANVAVHFLVMRPAWTRVVQADTEREAVNTEVRGLRMEAQRGRNWLDRLEKLEGNLEWFYDEQLSTKAERMTRIQGWVRELAREFKMDPASLSFATDAADEELGLVQWKIDFPLEGSYQRLRQFISRIEESEYFLIIDRVSLTGSREGGVLLNLNIGVHTYFEDPEAFADERSQRRRRG